MNGAAPADGRAHTRSAVNSSDWVRQPMEGGRYYGDLGRYVAGREHVLGGRVTVSTLSAETATAQLLEAGGRAFGCDLVIELERHFEGVRR